MVHHYRLGWLRWFMPGVAVAVSAVHLLALGGIVMVMVVSGASLESLLTAFVCMLPWLALVVWILVSFVWRLPLELSFDEHKLYWRTLMRAGEASLDEVRRIGTQGRVRVGVTLEFADRRSLKLIVRHGLAQWAHALRDTCPDIEVDLGAISKQLERLGAATERTAYSVERGREGSPV